MTDISLTDPFFLFYDARSGSTFLSNLLIQKCGVAIPPESNFIPEIFVNYDKYSIETTWDLRRILDIIYKERKFTDWNLEKNFLYDVMIESLPITLSEFIKRIFYIYINQNFSHSNIIGVKKGSYIYYVDQLKQIFPKAKFIGIIRDGRAVFNSKKKSIYSATGEPFENNPYCAAKQWCKVVKMLHDINKKYGIFIVHYEEMIQNPLKTLKDICLYLALSCDSSNKVGDVGYFVSERYGDLHANINRTAINSRVSAWKTELTKTEIFAFESLAYKKLEEEGYSLLNSINDLKNIFKRNYNKMNLLLNIH